MVVESLKITTIHISLFSFSAVTDQKEQQNLKVAFLSSRVHYNPLHSYTATEALIFFKQKTAYEISECEWSSDVCSSDLNSSHIQKSRMPSSACDWSSDRKRTRLNSSHIKKSRMPSSAREKKNKHLKY